VIDIDQLKKRFRTLRIHSGLTQQEFAAKAGFDYKFYQYLESPRKKQIWFETIDRIAEGHGLECWQLLHPDYAKYSKDNIK